MNNTSRIDQLMELSLRVFLIGFALLTLVHIALPLFGMATPEKYQQLPHVARAAHLTVLLIIGLINPFTIATVCLLLAVVGGTGKMVYWALFSKQPREKFMRKHIDLC